MMQTDASEAEAVSTEPEAQEVEPVIGYHPEYLDYSHKPDLATAKLVQVRKVAEHLSPEICMLGWFGPRPGEMIVPLNKVECHVLYRGEKEWNYQFHKHPKKSVMHVSVPLIHRDIVSNLFGTIHIGGDGWRYFLKDKQMCYTRKPDLNPGGWVGTLRDVFSEPPTKKMAYAFGGKDAKGKYLPARLVHLNQKLIWQAGEVLKDDYVDSDIFRYPDTEIRMPKFLTVVRSTTKPRIRQGKVLDNLVLTCANSGNWPIRHSVEPHSISDYLAYNRGVVKLFDRNTVQLTTEDGMIRKHSIDEASQELETLIEAAFGISAGIKLVPIVAEHAELRVKFEQPMFRPIPRRDWTLEQLKALPEYEALQCMAALTTAIKAENSILLDHEVAFSVEDPLVDFSDLPFMVQKLENPTRYQAKLDCREHPLCLSTPSVLVNLLDVPIKTFVHSAYKKPAVTERHDKHPHKPQPYKT